MQTPTSHDGVSVHTGFPNAAIDSSLQGLDLNTLLIEHPVSTYFMRIRSNSWQQHGIQRGDIVVIDKALKPKPNDLVVCWHDGEFMISPLHALLEDSVVWGVVRSVIHQLHERYTPPKEQKS